MIKYLKYYNFVFLLLYIIPLCLIFLATIYNAFGFHNVLYDLLIQIRGVSVLIFSAIGYLIAKKGCAYSLSKKALWFSTYMFLITALTIGLGNFATTFAMLFFWSFTLLISEKINVTTLDFNLISLIIAITCNILSLYYLMGRPRLEIQGVFDQNQAVGAVNSIYLVLSVFPFVFAVRNKYLKLGLMIVPLLCFFLASKTTCLIGALLSVCYYYYDTFKNSKHKIRTIFLALIAFIVIINVFSSYVNVADVLFDINEDVDSGGNGRLNQYTLVLQKYFGADIFNILFGQGMGSVARDCILQAHNDFIEVLYSYGVIGFSIFISFWISLLMNIKRIYNRDIKSVYVISLIVFFCVCTASNFLNTQIQMLFFCLLWGFVQSNKINSKL